MQLIESLRTMWRRIKRWVFWKRNLSAGHIEMRYWRKAGISKGSTFYKNYLDCFAITGQDLAGKVICDFGSGPLGGMIQFASKGVPHYAVDVLAEQYNSWGHSPERILPFNGGPTEIPAGSCDIVFCLNVIDHTTKPELIVKELERILKPGGTLYLFVHARKEHEINDCHPLAWDEALLRGLFRQFQVKALTHMTDTPNERPDLAVMTAVLTRVASHTSVPQESVHA